MENSHLLKLCFTLIKQIMKKYIKLIILISVGMLGGFLYYQFWGCESGCAIKSNPYTVTFYGGLIGFILGFPTNKNHPKK